MRHSFMIASLLLWSAVEASAQAPEQADVRSHADRSFEQLAQQKPQNGAPIISPPHSNGRESSSYSPEHYLIGRGQGDMTKGPIVCQRVSELSARTDLAKQIRVLVKEHMVDRLREQGGRDAQQDIELTREEIVQEYLQGVQIVDRRVDEENHICSATAVMPKPRIQPPPPPERLDPAPVITR